MFATCVINFLNNQSINTFKRFLLLLEHNCVWWWGGLETNMTPKCAIKWDRNRRTRWTPYQSYQNKQESEEFPTRFRGLLPSLTKNGDFSEKGDDILGHRSLRVPGTPYPPSHLFGSFHTPQIGGSLHWWSYNSCCHVWVFTVKLKRARVMSLGTKWRLHVLVWLFWGEVRVGVCLDASGQKGFPRWK